MKGKSLRRSRGRGIVEQQLRGSSHEQGVMVRRRNQIMAGQSWRRNYGEEIQKRVEVESRRKHLECIWMHLGGHLADIWLHLGGPEEASCAGRDHVGDIW